MTQRFFTCSVDIPKLEGIEDLFKGLMLCNNGSIVVAYKRPVIFDNVNVADRSVAFQSIGLAITSGEMVALDMRVLR